MRFIRKRLTFLSASLILVLFLIVIFSAQAAGISNLSDQMTRMAPSTASDHTFSFTSAAGLQNAGDYFRLWFKSADFNFNAVDFSDMELTWGPTGTENSEPLNSVPTAAAYGVTLGADTIDFVHPTNNAVGDIAPGSVIIIKIGLNASGAVRQIINPATEGSKAIYISSNLGEIGGLAVAISNDQVGVNADVSGGVSHVYPPADPTIDDQSCPYFWTPAWLSGGLEAGSTIFINNSPDNVEYPTAIAWRSLRDLILYGANIFQVFAQKNGLNSGIVTAVMKYWRVGDTQGDRLVNYYDLSNEAWYWLTAWCYGDFFHNNKVDYYDLSGLAWNWD